MALSNILREPRREVVETAVGIGGAAFVIWLDWHFAAWATTGYTPAKDDMPYGLAFGLCLLLGAVLGLIGIGLITLTHTFGDWLCDGLERHWGLHLRRTRRY